MKRIRNSLLISFVLTLLAFLLSGCVLYEVTETTDINDYGVLIGQSQTRLIGESDYEIAERDFTRLFPEKIEPFFQNVQYYYRTNNYNLYYEIYLEFTIPDQKEFEAYLATLPPKDTFHPFPYDAAYLEYSPERNYLDFSNVAEENREDGEGTEYYRINCANIQKILINPETRHIVIVCLRSSEDNITKTTEIHFLQRFQIDPQEFAHVEKERG